MVKVFLRHWMRLLELGSIQNNNFEGFFVYAHTLLDFTSQQENLISFLFVHLSCELFEGLFLRN